MNNSEEVKNKILVEQNMPQQGKQGAELAERTW